MSLDVNLVIGGEAGQGLVTIGQLLGRVLVRAGHEILVTQSYHSRIRGGHNTFAIRFGSGPFLAPRESIDILVALNAETVDLHREQLTGRALLVADRSFAPAMPGTMAVPFAELGPEQLWNTGALGLLGSILGFSAETLFAAVEAMLGGKHPEALAENREILHAGHAWAADHAPPHEFDLSSGGKASDQEWLLLNGNEAIALGALAAGLKFCAFYPMTPATSVVLAIIGHGDAMGCVVEQAEDEIAAINMAIGASFAGAPSMVATSGGGFALMVEGVSLAGMTETPVLLVVAQRPGPATGLPTRTEQADLEFVLHAGHGEFPRAIFAPGSLESCFHLTARALHLAEKSQSPVFLLTDQFLADASRPVAASALDGITPVRAGDGADGATAPYQRYRIMENGLSPRLLPGMSEHLVVADSDEHDEAGHITEDLGLRVRMVEKRLKKLEIIRRETIPPSLDGEQGGDLLFVCWGSAQGPVLEAAAVLRGQGRSVSVLHFEQVWPLVPAQFLPVLSAAKTVVCVEGNATAQFARLLRRETGFAVSGSIGRYDGLPFTARYILERLAGAEERRQPW